MEAIEIGGRKYEVMQTDAPDKKWVQTSVGEKVAIRVNGIWIFGGKGK